MVMNKENSEMINLVNSLGFKQLEVAALMGVHQNTISQWMRGIRKPESSALAFARVLDWLRNNNPEAFDQMLIELYLQGEK